MHHKACFWKPFGSERVNESKNLLKSSEKYFYPAFSSFWAKLRQKKLYLVRSEILGLFFNALTGDYEYSRSNGDNLLLPIQMQLSGKSKGLFYAVFESTLNFKCFGKQVSLIDHVFLKLFTPKNVLT